MERKILIVDDDPEDREIISDAFKAIEAEHLLHFESNGEKALLYAEQQFGLNMLPSLIIIDLNMPKLSGTQTLRLLKNEPRFRDIPVVIFSTSLNDIQKKECMDLGAHSYMIKPIYYKDSVEIAEMFYKISKGEV